MFCLQIDAESEEQVSFGEMLQNCKSVSAELCSRGVGVGDLVVLCSDQNCLSYTVLFAAIFTGSAVVIVPTSSKIYYTFNIRDFFNYSIT